MITALSPKRSTELAMPTEVKSSDAAALTPLSEVDRTTPNPDWKREDYEQAMVLAILDDRTAEAETINTAYLATSEAGTTDNTATWAPRKILLAKSPRI